MQTIFGHVVSTTYYEQDGTQKETINYVYDDEGKTTTEIAYDVNGNVIRAYEYDRNNNFVTVRNSITGNTKNEIEYDDNGQMVEYISYENEMQFYILVVFYCPFTYLRGCEGQYIIFLGNFILAQHSAGILFKYGRCS